ncbi:PQQ-dependent sugar dehydrogenase [Vulgatibacter sp.]|uniref:PQQ-dependent sugar dehydrogenase n=1 Tax=Vulgatibacter sp. TaxID=1971226 RepID=UPI003561DCEE
MRQWWLWLVLAWVGCGACAKEPAHVAAPGGSGGTGGSGGGGGGCFEEPDGTPAAHGLDSRPANPTCIAPARPRSEAAVALERAFPALQFTRPVGLLQPPGDRSWFWVVEQNGRVLRFANEEGAASAEPVIDLQERIDARPMEGGLLGLAFHPRFESNGQVYLSFTDQGPSGLRSVIARYVSADGGATLDPASESIVLTVNQPYANHNGGHVAFGPDGMLYIGFGDGGSGGDPLGSGQDLRSRLGKILRIDVDAGAPFAVPDDNPWAGGGGDPTIWAHGLRNPWRFSFDRATGDLWAGDVGQNAWEEVDRIVRGGNYGWNVREGAHCYDAVTCETAELIDPVAEYDHGQGQSITGGFVYRGAAIPALAGVYLYGDFSSGRLWGLFSDDEGAAAPRVLIESTGLAISSFAEDAEGALYLLDWIGGGIHRIVPAGATAPDAFPAKLSETGCFDPADPTVPVEALLPYDVIAPLWSDGAEKKRWFAIPDGTSIGLLPDGDFDFPPGSVLVKEFRLGCERVETRLFVRHEDGGWAGYSYAWNEAQTDAELLPAGALRTWGERSWEHPSRADCMRCHTAAAGWVLGVEQAQLDRETRWPGGRRANVLATLERLGLLQGTAEVVPALVDPHGDAPMADRARSYLHGNCSGCHRPGGGGQGVLDLRMGTPFAEAGLCNVPPQEGELGLADPRLVAPGAPERSIVAVRMERLGAGRMPPVGSGVVDEAGLALVEDWIRGLPSCP